MNRVVVITGASGGIGAAAARLIAQQGDTVALVARRKDALDRVATDCGAAALALPADVTDRAQVRGVVQDTIKRLGRIDVWINNAGAGAIGQFDAIPLHDHAQVIETTLLGTLYGSYVALRQFRKQRRGILINVGSVAGKVPSLYYASYSAAKHGVIGLSAALRLELEENEEDRDIRVCTLLPDAHDTPFFQHAANYSGHEITPPPPVHDPQEVIDAMLELARSPRDEMTVGSAGKVAVAAERISAGLAGKMMARSHEKQMESPPAPPTDGALLEPKAGGTAIRGGWKPRKGSKRRNVPTGGADA